MSVDTVEVNHDDFTNAMQIIQSAGGPRARALYDKLLLCYKPCATAFDELGFQSAMDDVETEIRSAFSKWPRKANSAHEQFAILAEEVDELWEHVKTNQKRRDLGAMRAEAIQVAAMAVRFVVDVCNEEVGRR